MNENKKIFSVSEQSEAVSQAAELFGCSEELIHSVVIEEGDEERDWLVFAMRTGEPGNDAGHLDASYNLFFEEEGVYLETYPHFGRGEPLVSAGVLEYIKRKALDGLDTDAVSSALEKDATRVKIAPSQEEKLLSEDISVTISANAMEAYITFLPPDEGGASLTVNQINEKLGQQGVVFGVSPIGLGAANREKIYGKQYLIAHGAEPVHGEDGCVTYHFDRAKKEGRPVEDEAGRVDYRDLGLFEPVKKGQLLLTRTLATEGKPGSTVTGTELKPRPGKEVLLPKTKNTEVNEAFTEVHAAESGYVAIIDGAVCVMNTYTIKGDCDLSTGSIDFDGNVVIVGAVIPGMTVKATGNITIGGVVDNAEIIAGGDVELKRGIQGGDKGSVTAGGTITASFIERADIRAGLDVIADVILHSNIEVGRQLELRGKRGNIVGGKALVAERIIAKTIGAPSHVTTDIEVGLLPEKVARIKQLREELKALAKEKAKIDQVELYLSRAENVAEEKRETLTRQVEQTMAEISKRKAGFDEELGRLEYEAEHAIDGRIHCSVVVYPGARITIGPGNYRVDEQTQCATFKYDKGEVVFGSCEVF